ncbi:MAG: hypothetical protein RMX68_016670 [Aulosira sp. ZfuVER01]|nr:hypothetical protein [Aulosira sp. ZfuVER01]MDZ8000828.1 hypothetical protein [Aulosira sp. DedVER01a]MDZ8055901.1 hypothetical protein [Aulosira sp. ZfuCHP01]
MNLAYKFLRLALINLFLQFTSDRSDNGNGVIEQCDRNLLLR